MPMFLLFFPDSSSILDLFFKGRQEKMVSSKREHAQKKKTTETLALSSFIAEKYSKNSIESTLESEPFIGI